VLKLDYEKVYDRVSWDFLFEVLRTRGFSPTWIRWIALGDKRFSRRQPEWGGELLL